MCVLLKQFLHKSFILSRALFRACLVSSRMLEELENGAVSYVVISVFVVVLVPWLKL